MSGAVSRPVCAAPEPWGSRAKDRASQDGRVEKPRVNHGDGAAPRADRNGGVGITSIYWSARGQWGPRAGQAEQGNVRRRTC
jgi:hypothetical protein